jgi:HSP20 family protein
MENKKKSFFEKLTGASHEEEQEETENQNVTKLEKKNDNDWIEEENEEAELTVDVYQTSKDIVIQAMVAGVKPENLELTIARDMVTIRGKRGENRHVDEDNYFTKELYWGKFSRTILLPQEIEPEEVEALEKHGLLTIKLQKVDKDKKNVVRVKSI